MKKIHPNKIKLLAIFMATALVTGCNSGQESNTSRVQSTIPVGDFNFIDQKPVSSSSEMSSKPSQSESVSNNSGAGIISNIDISSENTSTPTQSTTGTIEEPPLDTRYISPYVDLTTNSSIQIGADVYVSVPQTVIEKRCGLDMFIETYRLAHTLVNKEDYDTQGVIDKTYKNGTCVSVAGTTLYINGKGIGYWCKCTTGTIDQAKKPDISLFNLGELKGVSGSMTARYSALGTLLDSEENDLFYRAVYSIQDLDAIKDNPISARAVLIYNKETGAISTCLIYINSKYCEDEPANLELLSGSVRFSTVPPDNLVSLV